MLRYGWDFGAEFWSTCDMTWRRYFDERTQPLGPSCLWQCLLFISLSPIPFPFDQFQIIRSKHPPPPNRKEIIKIQISIYIVAFRPSWENQTLHFVDNRKVSHLELNKPSKHQIERPLFLKDCTIASVYFPPPFGPLIWWRSTPTEDLEPNISTMWRSVSSWIVESNPILILSSRSLFSTSIFKMLFAYV